MGMALGLAALLAWSVFRCSPPGWSFRYPSRAKPIGPRGPSLARLKARQNTTAQSLFQNFLRVARELSLAAIFPALAIGPERRRVDRYNGLPRFSLLRLRPLLCCRPHHRLPKWSRWTRFAVSNILPRRSIPCCCHPSKWRGRPGEESQ